jgi:tetratricopeptide (TPR) repeat protein
MRIKFALLPAILLAVASARSTASPLADESLRAGRDAYEASEYSRAAQLLQHAAAQNPRDPEVHLLLAKTYYESQQHDAAIASAEKAVAINPQSSLYHEWLGKAYGEKAAHSGWMTALSLAKKSRREFEKAVGLDAKNFSARQALIEFDCSAPGIAGGGEDKARPEIARLAALDVAEGHYAAGNCRRQKKDFPAADAEFEKALASHPKSPDLIYDIGDYAMKHSQPQTLAAVSDRGEEIAPADPRGKFYRAVALILQDERQDDAARLLQDYLEHAPRRNNFPPPSRVHEWLGRLHENQHSNAAALAEYETALKLDPKNNNAREALKRLK